MYCSTACCRILITVCLLLGLSVPGSTQSGKRGQQDPRGIQLVPTVPAAPTSARRTALVIGNSAYIYTKALPNPVNDATDMAAALEQMGFQVIRLLNAKRQPMLETIAELGNKLRQGGVGLFFFAGHGLQVKGENYLVPVEAPVDSETLEDNMVPVQRILDR